MQKKELARLELARREESDTAKDARNASRAFRRAQREEEVSEDEGYEVESEAGASVNRDTYSVGSVSFFIPHAHVLNVSAHRPHTHLIPPAHSAQGSPQKSTHVHFMIQKPRSRLKVTGQ